jgi:galactokinase
VQAVVRSAGFPELIRVDLSDLVPRRAERGRPEALVRGVAAGVVQRGGRIGAIAACVDSTVLPGSGLSSSAAFGILIGGIFSYLFNGGNLSALDLARVAKQAENEFFGKPCGFMDQLASALGGILHIDFNDPLEPDCQRVDFDFTRAGYQLAVVDTGGSHAELTPEYAAVAEEMGAAARLLGRETLRGLGVDHILNALPRLREKVGDRAVLRAVHFIEENQRVAAMVSALRGSRIDAYLELVSASGDSSWRLLQNCFRTTNPREQGIPLALTLTRQFLDGSGACRVHGGGFEGTIQAYVPVSRFGAYRSFMQTIFGPRSVAALRTRKSGVVALGPDGLL